MRGRCEVSSRRGVRGHLLTATGRSTGPLAREREPAMNGMMKLALILRIGCLALLLGAAAQAHIELASGAATSNATNEVVFGIGHGCSGADTYRVKIDIPAGVT